MHIQTRVTGVLLENESILLLSQQTDTDRKWSLPGGKVEYRETLEQALVREIIEETGLEVRVGQLLYVCDNILENKHVLHITFLCERVGGTLGATDGLDTNKIHSVEFVPITQLSSKGFSEKFVSLVSSGFPDKGNYKGAKVNIGL